MRSPRLLCLSLTLSFLLVVACGDSGSEQPGADTTTPPTDIAPADTAPPPPMSRLRAEGTAIVDEDGNPVRLRGLNLGSWAFHETWITLFDYSVQSRVYLLGVERGMEEDVTAALQAVGPFVAAGMVPIWGSLEDPDEPGWVAAFGAALEEQTSPETAQEFMAALGRYRVSPFQYTPEEILDEAGRD